MIEIEVCANSIESIIAAKQGGAKRVEICDNLEKGGTTPPLSWVEYCRKYTELQTFTLIRPRESDYLYSENEFYSMKRDIIHFGAAGCHGVVLGILTKDGKVDMLRCKELIDLAKYYAMSVTFHRAIDRTENILEALESVISLGCDRILTSGGAATAIAGKEVLKEMILKAHGRIIILPGCGINESNIVQLAKDLDVKEFHGSFSIRKKSNMEYVKVGLDSFENEYTYQVTSAENVNLALNNVNKM